MDENTQNRTQRKAEILLLEINQLDTQVVAARDQLNILENKEKMEIHKKTLFEVRKDNMSRSIEFYQNFSQKMNVKLDEKQAAHLKFSVANECYDKLLEMYREKYFKPENTNSMEENSLLETSLYFQKQLSSLQKQNETLKLTIVNNSSTIKSLEPQF